MRDGNDRATGQSCRTREAPAPPGGRSLQGVILFFEKVSLRALLCRSWERKTQFCGSFVLLYLVAVCLRLNYCNVR